MADYKNYKRILDDIIDVAYAGDDKKDSYKKYRIYILPDEIKSMNGDYNSRSRTIRIYNPSRGHMHKTALHELAHHIDYCKNNTTGHKKSFYEEYRRLIYASLDMGILRKADFLHSESYDGSYASDSSKVEKMIREYKPSRINRKPRYPTVMKVFNGYDLKEELKGRGYRWNSIEKVWELSTADSNKEKEWLKEAGITETQGDGKEPYYIETEPSLRFDSVIKVTAEGRGVYENRNKLKELGFHWDKAKGIWSRNIKQNILDKEMPMLISELKPKGVDITINPYTNRTRRAERS
ncbi:MAG: hypothetical protein J5966_10510 [Lachnospiraceae bacterium]|nr:hypothetical protein [Lachnospiraceae bacterium]